MKVQFILCSLIITCSTLLAQTTKQLTANNGDGWYRIIEGTGSAGTGKVKIWGLSGSNRQTNITMFVSLMRYNQGGTINIVDNLLYNSNHIDEIRGGSVNNQNYTLDIHITGANSPTSIWVEVEGSLPILDIPVFNPTVPTGSIIEISGRSIGMTSTSYPINFNSKVGIGTTNPSEKLEVKGTIRTQEVKVESTDWPDYVFTDTYKLNSLSEVSTFISENGHLPNIPTAKEVKENGIKLGEMNAKLLEKIEELTLYQIELLETVNEMQKEIEQLKQNKK